VREREFARAHPEPPLKGQALVNSALDLVGQGTPKLAPYNRGRENTICHPVAAEERPARHQQRRRAPYVIGIAPSVPTPESLNSRRASQHYAASYLDFQKNRELKVPAR